MTHALAPSILYASLTSAAAWDAGRLARRSSLVRDPVPVIVTDVGIIKHVRTQVRRAQHQLNGFRPTASLNSASAGTDASSISSTDCVFSGARGHYPEMTFSDAHSPMAGQVPGRRARQRAYLADLHIVRELTAVPPCWRVPRRGPKAAARRLFSRIFFIPASTTNPIWLN